jgi:hypothetical protein
VVLQVLRPRERSSRLTGLRPANRPNAKPLDVSGNCGNAIRNFMDKVARVKKNIRDENKQNNR